MMAPQRQSEDQPSLLGNAREPPRLEGVIHMTGQILSSGINAVAVRAPDGSVGQIDSIRNSQLGQQGIAPGFEKMQAAMPADANVNQVGNGGQDVNKDESQKDDGPAGQHDDDVDRHGSQKDGDQKDEDHPPDDEYPDDKDAENNAQQHVEVRILNFSV